MGDAMTTVGSRLVEAWINERGICTGAGHTDDHDQADLARRIDAALAEAYEEAARCADHLTEPPPAHAMERHGWLTALVRAAAAICTLARERTGSVRAVPLSPSELIEEHPTPG